MTVLLNGSPREVQDGATLATLVEASAPSRLVRHTAAARNGEVVPRSAWSSTPLAEGDRIELLTAAQGG